ncbi:MAG: ornithine cyclodeaminase family protein [Acidobacteriaceae bacterium]|nr:ornithine cyclodeaminase family protein [Acidobacteriaceae bacterium]
MKLILGEPEVERFLSWEELLPAMENALRELSAGHVVQPVRSVLAVPEQPGWFGLMPCIYREVMGAKLVTVFPQNAEHGLPTHQASIHLFSRKTGELLCIMDGRLITARRTAAVSALATRALSRPDARILAIFGSGVQARTHLHALRMVRKFEEVRVWSRNREHALRFAAETHTRVMSAEEAAKGADVVVTVTHASEPVLHGAWLKEGVYVNAVGAVGPVARELDDDVMRGAAVVVESREAAELESAEIVQSGVPIYSELGEILAGSKPKPQASKTVFKSLGVAVEDVAAAYLVYEKAKRI